MEIQPVLLYDLNRCRFSSVGRATDSYSVGQVFDSPKRHHFYPDKSVRCSNLGFREASLNPTD